MLGQVDAWSVVRRFGLYEKPSVGVHRCVFDRLVPPTKAFDLCLFSLPERCRNVFFVQTLKKTQVRVLRAVRCTPFFKKILWYVGKQKPFSSSLKEIAVRYGLVLRFIKARVVKAFVKDMRVCVAGFPQAKDEVEVFRVLQNKHVLFRDLLLVVFEELPSPDNVVGAKGSFANDKTADVRVL